MKERPILFSGPMVSAILDGTTTQTRRVVKPQPEDVEGASWLFRDGLHHPCEDLLCRGMLDPIGPGIRCPYGVPGDRLWVRECFATESDDMGVSDAICHYRADFVPRYGAWEQDVAHDAVFRWEHPWRPSIHMPRWASRITLEVTSVRVERVQDISEEDARAEGISAKRLPLAGASGSTVYHAGEWPTPVCGDTARGAFKALWESINGADSWAADPWVWVVGFKRVEGGNHNRKGLSPTSGDGLSTQVGGALNPTWVEWLMGFPLGWTASALSETPSCQSRPPELSSSSGMHSGEAAE